MQVGNSDSRFSLPVVFGEREAEGTGAGVPMQRGGEAWHMSRGDVLKAMSASCSQLRLQAGLFNACGCWLLSLLLLP